MKTIPALTIVLLLTCCPLEGSPLPRPKWWSAIHSICERWQISRLSIILPEEQDLGREDILHPRFYVQTLKAGKGGLHFSRIERGSGVVVLGDSGGIDVLEAAGTIGLLEKMFWFIQEDVSSANMSLSLSLRSLVFILKPAPLASSSTTGEESVVELSEIYAIKKGSPIVQVIGEWSESTGLSSVRKDYSKPRPLLNHAPLYNVQTSCVPIFRSQTLAGEGATSAGPPSLLQPYPGPPWPSKTPRRTPGIPRGSPVSCPSNWDSCPRCSTSP